MSCFRLFSIVLILSLFVSPRSFGQQLDSLPVPKQDQFLLHSKSLKEDRTIWVYMPPDYLASTDSFPILYLIDGGKHFPYVRELVEYLSNFEQPYIPHMIVVAIPNTDRGRDLTPSKGASQFLAFLRDELVPYIDGHYRTHPYRVLAGHSLGGLFTVYTNAKAPQLFQSSILISPALDSSDADTRQLVAEFGNTLQQDRLPGRRFFISLGNEKEGGVNLLKRQLEKSNVQDRWSDVRYPSDNHFSVPYKSMYDGLRWLYKGWFMDVFLNKQKRSWQEIERHFDTLSARFGYKVLPSEDFINGCGYAQLRAGNLPEAIGIFQANIRLHSRSWNAFDSLGEAWMKAGNKAEAISNYEQSVKLNPANKSGIATIRKLKGQ